MPQITSFDEKLLGLIKNMKNNVKVKSIIRKKKLYNVTDSSKNTLLHKATQSENTEIVRYLIDSGSKVDVQNELGQTPWMLAIRTDCEETIEVLIEAGAMELQDSLGKSALQIIGESKCTTVAAFSVLLPKLQSVCSNNKEEIAKMLIDARWPLQLVVVLKDSDLTRIVLQRGYASKIDELYGSSQTALHLAVEFVDVENVKVLLEYNANVNFVIGIHDSTSLCYVYYCGSDRPNDRLDILKMLLDRGATIDSGHGYGAYEVFKYASGEVIKKLYQSSLEKSANFDQLYALKMLIENDDSGAIEEIHGTGFDVNARNASEQTPLMLAVMHGNTRAIEFLLDEGADIEAVDNEKRPALYYALQAHSKYEQCVQILLERGADVQYEFDSPLQDGATTILDLILRCNFSSLGSLVADHIALQDILGTTINKNIRSHINSCAELNIHFGLSKIQLSLEVYESATLFDVLTAITGEKFEKYARNEEFVSKCEDTVAALFNHPYYRTILQRRLSKAVPIAALKVGAGKMISKAMGMSYDRFPLIADYIISFLEHEDMKNLKNI